MKKKNTVDLLQGNVSETFMKYMVPSVSATIMISFNYFIDTLCIGQKLGESGLAALNLSWPITTLLYAIGLMFGTGGGAMYSAFLATGEVKRARSIFTGGFFSVVVIGILVTVLSLIFLDPIVTVLGGAGALRQGVTDYVKWVVIFSFSYMAECFFVAFLRNDNAPKLAMVGTLLSCSLNIILDIWIIFFLDGGLAGAALATSLAVTSKALLGIATSFGVRKTSNMKICFEYLSVKEIFCMAKVGMSVFLTEVNSGIVTFVYNAVLIRIAGTAAAGVIAIYGIVVNINTIVLASINGIANAMQPIVSANSGAGRFFRVRKFTNLAVKWAFGMAVVLAIALELKAEWFVKIFLMPDPQFLIQAAYAIRIVSASYILASINMIIISYFQSVQAAKQAIYFSFLRTLILPLVYVVSGAFFLGIEGVWGTSLMVEATSLIILFWAYRYYQRKSMEDNLGQLNFYDFEEEVESIEDIIEVIGADNLEGYLEVMEYCLQRDTENEGVPMVIGLDDLTAQNRQPYVNANEEELSFHMAIGELLFTDLFEQRLSEEGQDEGKAITLAMNALAEKFFQQCRNEDGEFSGSVGFREVIYELERTKG